MPTEEVTAFPFGEGGGFTDGRGLCGGKCSHSADFIMIFRLNWGKCRRRETLLSTENKNGKEGLFQIKNKRAISIKTNFMS